MKLRAFLLPTLAALCLPAPHSQACSVPVFRYALERWVPEVYDVVVFHKEPLHAEIEAALAVIEDTHANVVLTRVNAAAELSKDWEAFIEKNKVTDFPQLVVRFPPWCRRFFEMDVVWSVPLTRYVVPRVLDSPARDKVIEGIVDGNIASWVLIESGDEAKDDAAVEVLTKELEAFKKAVDAELEEQGEGPPQGQVDPWGPPVRTFRAKYSLVRVSRRDSKEDFFRAMLLATEEDLKEYAAEPIAFPIFGQGRALFALVGKGIKQDIIAETCEFLFGACSCTVKEQNPGIDLVMNANWLEIVPEEYEQFEEPPELTGVTADAVPSDESDTGGAGEDDEPDPARAAPYLTVAGLTFTLLLLLVIGASVLIIRKKR